MQLNNDQDKAFGPQQNNADIPPHFINERKERKDAKFEAEFGYQRDYDEALDATQEHFDHHLRAGDEFEDRLDRQKGKGGNKNAPTSQSKPKSVRML